jgi:hypothetical protein
MTITLFHFARAVHASGSFIEPGNFGRIIREQGEQHPLYRREMFYENIRQMSFPHRPSRLDCLFCFPTLDEAQRCRLHIKGYADSVLHVVATDEPADFVADMNNHIQHFALATFDPNLAAFYWLGWQQSHDPRVVVMREVLLRRPAQVVGVLTA